MRKCYLLADRRITDPFVGNREASEAQDLETMVQKGISRASCRMPLGRKEHPLGKASSCDTMTWTEGVWERRGGGNRQESHVDAE